MRQKQRWRGLLKRNTPVYEEKQAQQFYPLIMGCDVDMKTCWTVILVPKFEEDNDCFEYVALRKMGSSEEILSFAISG